MRKRTVALLLVMVMVVASALVGCSSSNNETNDKTNDKTSSTPTTNEATQNTDNTNDDSSEPVELTIWTHESTSQRVAAWDYVIKAFQEKYPNIKVTNEVVLWDDFQSKFLNAIQTNTAPDLVAVTETTWSSGYQVGGLVSLDDVVNNLDVTIMDNLIASYKTDGHYYAIPFASNCEMLFYRPSMLKAAGLTEPPKTWDELLDYAKKLTVDKDGDGTPDQYGIGITTGRNDLAQNTFAAFMATAGVDVFDKEGNVDFNNEKIVSTFKLYKDLAAYTPAAASGWSWGEIEMNWAAGTFAMFPYSSPNLSALLEANDTDIACALLPSPDGSNVGHCNMVHSLAMTADCESRGNKEAASKFLQFILQPEMSYVLSVCQEPGLYFPTTKEGNELLASGYFNEEAFPLKNWDNTEGSATQTILANINDVGAQTLSVAHAFGHKYGPVNLNFASIYGSQVFADVIQKCIIDGESPEDAVKWGADSLEELASE